MTVHQIFKSLFKGYEQTLAAVISKIITTLKGLLGQEPSMTKAISLLENSLEDLNAAIGRVRKSELTEKMALADRVRDNSYRSFVLSIDSALLRKNQVIADAAQILNAIIDNVGRSAPDGYNDQNNHLERLFSAMGTDAASGAIDTIGARDCYEELTEAAQDFIAIQNDKTWENLEKKEIPSLRDALQSVISAFNNRTAKRLEIEAIDNGEPFSSVIERINAVVEQAHVVQRSRISRNDKTDKPIEESSAEEEKPSTAA